MQSFGFTKHARRACAVACVASAALLGGLAAAAASQDDRAPGGEPPMDPAMMEAFAKYAAPDAHHAELAQKVGSWKTEIDWWMAPGAPPQRSTGSADYTMELGGRFLVEKVNGVVLGQKFEGMGITAYDTAAKRYEFTWFDSMGTGMMKGVGKPRSGGKGIDWKSRSTDPMTGEDVEMRSVEKWNGANEMVMEMYGAAPDGAEFLMMRITYTRR